MLLPVYYIGDYLYVIARTSIYTKLSFQSSVILFTFWTSSCFCHRGSNHIPPSDIVIQTAVVFGTQVIYFKCIRLVHGVSKFFNLGIEIISVLLMSIIHVIHSKNKSTELDSIYVFLRDHKHT